MRAGAAWAGGLLVALAAAGCLGGDADDAPTSGAASPPQDGPQPEAPPDLMAGPPAWVPGQWWTWEVTGRNYGTTQVTTVVASVAGQAYAVGVSAFGPTLEFAIFHLPPWGLVDRQDLAWLSHEQPVRLVDFPLVDGKSWSGEFDGEPLTVTVRLEAGAFHGHSVFEGTDDPGPRFVYDPTLGQFTELAIHYGGDSPFSSARLIDYGNDFSGAVYVLAARDKFLGGAGGPPASPTPPALFTSPPDKEWLVFGCYLGGTTGRFEIQFVTPSPTEEVEPCVLENLGTDFEFEVQVRWRASVPGDWGVVFAPLGAGFVEAEILGVFQQSCRLGPPEESTEDLPRC